MILNGRPPFPPDMTREQTVRGRYEGVTLQRHYAPEGEWLEVLHAEPQALFSAELLHSLRRGGGFPEVEVDHVGIGGVVRIQARNRTVLYRIVAEDFPRDLYIGEWPD